MKKDGRYNEKQSILVLGDGDFSFTYGLGVHCNDVWSHICATSLDSRSTVIQKYGADTKRRLEILEKSGATLCFGVDATNIVSTLRTTEKFDRVIFNFPHSGKQRVHINRELIRKFFVSCRRVVKPLRGEVHLTLKDAMPYSSWGADLSASTSGFCSLGSFPFIPNHFPGYKHRTTDPTADVFDHYGCRTTRYVIDPKIIREQQEMLKKKTSKVDDVVVVLDDDVDAKSATSTTVCSTRQRSRSGSFGNMLACMVCRKSFRKESSLLQHLQNKKDKAHEDYREKQKQDEKQQSPPPPQPFPLLS